MSLRSNQIICHVYTDVAQIAGAACSSCSRVKPKTVIGEDMLVNNTKQYNKLKNTIINGKLTIIGLEINKWPEGLEIKNCLEFKNCDMEYLPDGINIVDKENFTLTIQNCNKFIEFPTNLNIKKLKIDNCPNVEFLPENIKVKILTIQNCNKFKFKESFYLIEDESKENLNIIHLTIDNCPNVEFLPENINVSNTLSIQNCDKFNVIKGKLQTNSIDLQCNGELEGIPDLKCKILTIKNCNKLINLEKVDVADRGCFFLYSDFHDILSDKFKDKFKDKFRKSNDD